MFLPTVNTTHPATGNSKVVGMEEAGTTIIAEIVVVVGILIVIMEEVTEISILKPTTITLRIIILPPMGACLQVSVKARLVCHVLLLVLFPILILALQKVTLRVVSWVRPFPPLFVQSIPYWVIVLLNVPVFLILQVLCVNLLLLHLLQCLLVTAKV